jgi:hypothetical protein
MHSNAGQTLDPDGPDPRARSLAWYIGHLRRRWQGVSEDEVRGAYRTDDPVAPKQRLAFKVHMAARVPPFALEQILATSDHEAVARLRDTQGRRWRVRAIMHPAEPDRLRWAFITQEPPPGVVIRPAELSDGPALAALERRVPIIDGEVRRTYDRGEDYFVAAAVPNEHLVLVAEVDGVLSGMTSQVLHPARADGRLLRLAYLRHFRVDPGVQGRGVFSALNGMQGESAIPHCDAPWSLTGASNEAVDSRGMRLLMRSPVVQLCIDARAAARPLPLPRPPARDDATALAEFLARSVGPLELSRTWSSDDVVGRVEGVGVRYGWDRIALTEQAVLGVEKTPVTVETAGPGGTSIRREVMAFDIGAVPGQESQLLDLVRAWCSRLVDEGIDDLLMVVSNPALRRALEPLATRSTSFNLNHQFPVAADADVRGYFIDGMLF